MVLLRNLLWLRPLAFGSLNFSLRSKLAFAATWFFSGTCCGSGRSLSLA